jgi:glycosyltransferase involved in cell wall biosynthesis
MLHFSEQGKILAAGKRAAGSVSVFFPTFNEEENIEQSVRRAREALETAGVDYEVIVVNDASTDRTAEIADRLAAEDRHVRVVHLPRNLKLGGALKAGFAASRMELVFYTDADLPIDFADMTAALPLVADGGVEVVTGYRLNRDETLRRKVYSRAYNWLVNFLFGFRFRDINFSFKLFRREVIEQIDLRSNGSFIDAEILVEARKAGFSIEEVGVRYYPRVAGVSTLASPGVIVKILVELIAYMMTRYGRKPAVKKTAGER